MVEVLPGSVTAGRPISNCDMTQAKQHAIMRYANQVTIANSVSSVFVTLAEVLSGGVAMGRPIRNCDMMQAK